MKRLIIIITAILLFIILLLSNDKVNENPIIQVLDKENNEIALLNNKHITNTININDLNETQINYIIQIEDKDFYTHKGFSLKRIIKATFTNIKNNEKQGASTITQQYVKNTYLNNNKTITRKLKEIILAIKIENKLTKDEILTEYLSSIYFGNNIYGLTNAAIYYYNKRIQDLTDYELISLIALWNKPSVYSNNIEKWNNKTNIYLKKLGLSPCKIKLNLNKSYISSHKLYYIDEVINELKKQKLEANFGNKIIIKTAYNKKLEVIKTDKKIDYSLLIYDEAGYVAFCIGGKNYFENSFNIATNSKRDIGSTIKPILYYEAIKCGLKDQKFNSSPYSFNYKDSIATITNSSGIYYGNINMKKALAVSDNIYATKMHNLLGYNTLVYHLKKYNIEAKPYPSLALGSVGMSLMELTNIYYQFFKNGLYVTPKFINEISINNKTIKSKPQTKQLLNKKICEEIHNLLHAPFDVNIENSTCSSIQKNTKTTCYGKSGSTDYDSYLIGFTDSYLISCWCGTTNTYLTDKYLKRVPKELFLQALNLLN